MDRKYTYNPEHSKKFVELSSDSHEFAKEIILETRETIRNANRAVRYRKALEDIIELRQDTDEYDLGSMSKSYDKALDIARDALDSENETKAKRLRDLAQKAIGKSGKTVEDVRSDLQDLRSDIVNEALTPPTPESMKRNKEALDLLNKLRGASE